MTSSPSHYTQPPLIMPLDGGGETTPDRASLSLIAQAAAKHGGIVCKCDIPAPLGPAGKCDQCGTEGPKYQEYLKAWEIQEVNGTRVSAADDWEEKQSNPLLDQDGYVDWFKAFEAAPEDVPWIVEPFLEEGMTHALWGTPGHGKSLFALETIVHHVIMKYPVLYVDSENHLLRIVIARLKSFGMTPEMLSNLRMKSFSQIAPLDTAEGGQQLLTWAMESRAKLVVIDTTSRFMEGDENAADTFLRFYNHTLMLLKRHNIASLRLDHPGKDTSRGTRGSSAKYGDIDYEFSIEDPEDGKTPYRKLTCTKSRTGDGLGKGNTIMLRKHGVTETNDHFWHEWDYKVTQADAQLVADMKTLDELGVPQSVGKPTARTALVKAGVEMGNPRLEAALRERKKIGKLPTDCPEQVPA